MSVDAYLDKREAFQRIDDRVTVLGNALDDAARAIRSNRETFFFSNAGGQFPSLVVAAGPSANAEVWLTGAQINELLTQWHKAREEMLQAWRSVRADRQSGLQPPPYRRLSST